MIVFSLIIHSQPPPPPPPDDDPPVGGNLPIGDGLIILTVLSAGYFVKKMYDIRQNQKKLF